MQYMLTKKQRERSYQSIIDFDMQSELNGCPAGIHPKIFKAQRDTLHSIFDELESQLSKNIRSENIKPTNDNQS